MNRNEFNAFLEQEYGQILDQMTDNVEDFIETRDQIQSLIQLKINQMRINWLQALRQIEDLNVSLTDEQREKLSQTYYSLDKGLF